MELNDSEAAPTLPRFLDDLEMIERKRIKLDSHGKQRWSLTERKEDNQVFAEMGVGILEESQSPADIQCKTIEDIENQSPNLRAAENRPPSSSKRPAALGNSASKRLKKGPDENSMTTVNFAASGMPLGSPQTTCGAHPALHRPPAFLPRHNTFDEENTVASSQDNRIQQQHSSKSQESRLTLSQNMIHLSSVDQVILDSSELDRTIQSNDHEQYYYKSEDDNRSSDIIIDSDIEVVSSRCEDSSSRLDDTSNHHEDITLKYDDDSSVSKSDISRINEDNNLDNRVSGKSEFTKERECFTALNQSFCGSCDESEKCLGHTLVNEDEDDGGVFSKLSDEVVLSILQWLPKRTLVRCMLVSRRWRRLGADGRLWARVDLGGRVLPSGALPTLMSRHPVALRLANAQLISPVVPEPLPCDWRVQYLDLSAASVPATCLTELLYASPGLVRLSLEGLALSKNAAGALARMKHLRALNLTLTTGLGTSGCLALAVPAKLENLNLAWAGLDVPALEVLSDVLPGSVQRLNLAGCRRTLTDNLVAKIINRCPGLVELDLSDCALLTGDTIPQLLSLPKLEHLALSRCYGLQPDDYIKLSGSASLQWLDVFGLLPFVSLTDIQRNLPHLQFNKFIHSSVARPTVGNRRTSIWGLRTRD